MLSVYAFLIKVIRSDIHEIVWLIHRTGMAVACAFILAAPGIISAVVQAATALVPTPQLVYPQMPSGFNPVTATSAQLAHYGLPPRPPGRTPLFWPVDQCDETR